ncbi:MAG: LCP family protein [Clostridia bacterium]|nr:LCP family protein [Clostridia bacterium]
MKKRIACIFVLMLVMAVAGLADGIRLKSRDLDLSKNRDRAVTNILALMQEGDRTQMVVIASVNTSTGKAVMVSVDPRLMVEIPEISGEVPLSEVYALGDRKSRGLLVARTLNRLLDLNISTYLAMDMSMIPEIVDEIGGVWITPTEEEDLALGLEADTWALDGAETLAYMRLLLPGEEDRNRSYEVMLQVLRQVAGDDLMSMMGAGQKLLSAMDTNVKIMSAFSLASSLKSDEHHTDLFLPQAEAIQVADPLRADAMMMQQKLTEVIYE